MSKKDIFYVNSKTISKIGRLFELLRKNHTLKY